MKKFFQLFLSLVFFGFGFSQDLKPIPQKVKDSKIANKSFVKYDLFTVDQSAQKQAVYKAAAEDITVMKLNKSEISRIISEKPDALEMTFPFEGKNISLELVKNNIFTQDFKVNTDKGYTDYTPGVYYHGIVKGNSESLVAISFFGNDVVGVISVQEIGNIVIGKVKNSEDFVSYNDAKLKASNPFTCSSNELLENQNNAAPSFDPAVMTAKKTDNCVRIYYETGYTIYTNKGSSITNVTNWVSAMQNNIATLYENDGITVALSEVFVWTTNDPYNGSGTSAKLNQFRSGRPTFNGDVAQLIKYQNPVSGGVAFVNTLCTNSNYSYVDVFLNYSDIPTFSWNIEAMTHEIGHNLGSPHTHDCFWNGNNTRIDGCGGVSGNPGNGTCASGPLPTIGGTIMSYCHLVSSIGINFANGFGPQPGALIRSRINESGCLGTDCIASCNVTVSGLTVNEVTKNSLKATIVDNTATSWKYRLSKTDGTIVSSGVTNDKVLIINNLDEATYYLIAVGAECSGPQAFAYEKILYTDADWCTGVKFTDTGGENGNYLDNQTFVKTFYPANPSDKLKMTFTQFSTEPGADKVLVYDGPNIASPRFDGATNISGNTIPGPFQSTHSTGAITFRFIPNNNGTTAAGWVANFECITLATNENSLNSGISISQTAAKGIFTIKSKEQVISYQVFDASGKVVKTVSKITGSQEKINLSSVPAGTYMVSIVTAKETIVKKIINK